MREMDAFEQAYKNGYAAGMKAAEEKIVYCKDCVCYHSGWCYSVQLNPRCAEYIRMPQNGFCSYGKRRSDG